MKKLFFLAAAVLASFSLFADTDTIPKANSGWEGTSVTLKHNECANGDKSIEKDGKTETFIKFRTGENNNTITLYVNEGIKVTGLNVRGYSNNSAAHITLSGVTYGKVAETPFTPVVFPLSGESNTEKYEKTGMDVQDSIILSFDNSEIDGSSNKKNKQIMAIIVVTYEVTATKYEVTYKANYGDVADVKESALKVKDNPFKLPKDQYFIGWNTAADGSGNAVAAGTALTQDTVLYAQWKAFTAEAKMEVDSGTVKPAKGVEVALKEGSTGGKMYFVGAKDDDYNNSFTYRSGGSVQISGGGADSIRVELADHALKVGSIIRMNLIAVKEGKPSINIVSANKTTIEFASNVKVPEKDTISAYYVVKADDGLAGASKFIIQRGGSSVIFNALLIEGLEEAVTPEEKSTDASIKSMEINKTAVTEKDGVFAYEVAADENLAKVKVEFVLADKATADKTSPLEIDVPAAGATAEETINVTAEDGVTKKAYKISITKAKKAEEALEDVTDGQKIMKSFENGQLVIIKNGVKYNAAGAVVR